jgi:fructosamine-3-kinase
VETQLAPIKLTYGSLRTALESFISEHLGRPWAVKEAKDLADFACHPAAILSDGAYAVFAKFSEAANGREQFEIEMAGLGLLAKRAGVLIPTAIGILPVAGGGILIQEAVPSVERTPHHWRQIGQALARLHKVKAGHFGLETDCYFGPLFQDNAPMDDWATFYAERRLLPGMKMAVDSGNLPLQTVTLLERVISRLPMLCGPQVKPSLLHGDAQQNNFVSSDAGAFVIDPAVYFGHPEMDLAYIDYFQPVPHAVFDGYQDELPIDAGFWERRHLWRIWGYLAAVTVEGGASLGKLTEAIQRFV